MSWSLVSAFIWIIAANFSAMMPTKTNHWNAAYVLIAVGVPLLGWVTFENGAVVGLLCLAAGVSILRWPVRYLGRWLKRKAGRGEPAE